MEHWDTVKRILRYLKWIQNMKVTYYGNININLSGNTSGSLPLVNKFREANKGTSKEKNKSKSRNLC